MSRTFKRGDHVAWNSEAGRVSGTVMKKVVSEVQFKGYAHHATKEEPQYFIKSDKTDHVAIHKGSALQFLKSTAPKNRNKTTSRKQRTNT
jgi:penicillin-binding protein-related factor A (putative recombinase)